MGFDNILGLVAGLSLFLLGMNLMGNGLENACGNKMKKNFRKVDHKQISRRFSRCNNNNGNTVIVSNNSNGCWVC